MENLIDYVSSYSREFQAKLRRINNLIDHNFFIGSSHEGIFRSFLDKFIPKRLSVNEGFIKGSGNQTSKQCDVIIWDHLNYSPYYIEGPFVIVPYDAVRGVIEIKTNLDKSEIISAFENLNSVKNISGEIYTGIFAFEGVKLKTTVKHLIDNIDAEFCMATNSIYTMNGWCLQLAKDKPLGDKGVYMQTRTKELSDIDQPVPLHLILPPKNNHISFGLTTYLAFLFWGLGFDARQSPFELLPGPILKGYVFPSYGIKTWTDKFEKVNDDKQYDFLNTKSLNDYLEDLDKYMEKIKS